MPRFDYNTYAQRGAESRLAELQTELAEIFRAFPDLQRGTPTPRRGRPARGQGAMGVVSNAVFATVEAPVKRRTRTPMTAAQKKAVGLRMKKDWAERKAQAGSKKR